MKVKDVLESLKGVDPELRVIIDDPIKDHYEIEDVAIEKDLDHDDDEPFLIVVIYPQRYECSQKIVGDYVSGFPVKFELNKEGDYEFRSETGLSLKSWKEDKGVYWVRLPDEEIEEIRAYKVEADNGKS